MRHLCIGTAVLLAFDTKVRAADSTFFGLGDLSPPASGDLLTVTDISDTTQSANWTSKKMTLGTLSTMAETLQNKDLTNANNTLPAEIVVAVSDETTVLTTGTGKVTFRTPFAMTVTGVRASLTTAQTSGSIFTVDVNEGGTSILLTKLTVDNTEKTLVTAAAPAISDSALADDAEITVDIDQIGASDATGLKVVLRGTR
jgi:hypothetical protein